MSRYAIRRAVPCMDDARAFAALEAATLGDSDLTPVEMCSALALPDHCCYLACAGPLCIGLLSTFDTPCAAGRRLELDMLAVDPAWRNQGVASAMVSRALEEGRARGISMFRAVVATDNSASRRVFQRLGLQEQGTRCELLTRVFAGLVPAPYLPAGWSEDWVPDLADSELDQWRLSGHRGVAVRNASGETVARLAMLPVQTMAYTGYWIEQLWAVNAQAATIALLSGAERTKAASSDEIGILVPAADSSLIRGAHQAGYVTIGEYDIFTVD